METLWGSGRVLSLLNIPWTTDVEHGYSSIIPAGLHASLNKSHLYVPYSSHPEDAGERPYSVHTPSHHPYEALSPLKARLNKMWGKNWGPPSIWNPNHKAEYSKLLPPYSVHWHHLHSILTHETHINTFHIIHVKIHGISVVFDLVPHLSSCPWRVCRAGWMPSWLSQSSPVTPWWQRQAIYLQSQSPVRARWWPQTPPCSLAPQLTGVNTPHLNCHGSSSPSPICTLNLNKSTKKFPQSFQFIIDFIFVQKGNKILWFCLGREFILCSINYKEISDCHAVTCYLSRPLFCSYCLFKNMEMY